MREVVARVEALLREDQIEAARELLSQLRTDSCGEVELLCRVAEICRELGWVPRLVVELNRAYALAPERLDLLRQIGQIHTDGGRFARALKCWRAIVERDPTDVEAWEELGASLISLERHEEAAEAFREAEQATGDKRFQAFQPKQVLAPAPRSAEASDAVVARFTHLFSGREGVYARQWANPQGESGYSPIHEPLTPGVVRAHLLGEHTVGSYVLRMDNTVNFAAIDLDLPRDVVLRASRKAIFERMRELRLFALKMVQDSGLPLALEESGLKGFHIWLLFGQPIPGRVARRIAMAIARRAGAPPAGVGVEVFPKQAEVPPDGLGNLIKLPLGMHRVSGQKGMILDEMGLPVEDPFQWILEAPTLANEDVRGFLESTAEDMPESLPTFHNPLVEYHLDADTTAQNVLARCCTLRTLADQAMFQNQLNHEEARVVIHTLGHLDTGPQAVNVLLRRAPELDPSLFMKSRLKGNPMSCARIRERVPHVTSRLPCHCEFEVEAGNYPNPLLHLHARDPGVTSLQLKTLVEDYLRSGKELREATTRHAQLVNRLSSWFEQAGVDVLETTSGVLRLTRDEAGQPGFRLEI